jgi:hypothetical protein
VPFSPSLAVFDPLLFFSPAHNVGGHGITFMCAMPKGNNNKSTLKLIQLTSLLSLCFASNAIFLPSSNSASRRFFSLAA